MLFNEYLENIAVWEKTPPADGWGDSIWTQVATIKARFEPIDGNEAFLQNQTFADVTDICLTDYENKAWLDPKYILVDADGDLRRIVGQPEKWKWGLINSHIASKCRRAQWEA